MIKIFDKDMNEIKFDIMGYQMKIFPLDNFSPYGFIMNNLYFPTSEHAFQYLKYASSDSEIADKIRKSLSPDEARIIGHQYTSLRDSNWSNIKYEKMEEVLRLKINQNTIVREALLKTQDYIIAEVCIDEDTDWGLDNNGQGENHLGNIWMKIRSDLRKED